MTARCTVDVLHNFALNKPASQSSTYSTQVALLAVDGRYDTASCTDYSMHPWFGVNLGTAHYVDHVVVTNDYNTMRKYLQI